MYPIKLKFNDIVRRTQIAEDKLTYQGLFDVTVEMFFSGSGNYQDFQIAYKDDEDDTVIVLSDEEIKEAIRVMQGDDSKAFRFIIIPNASGIKVQSSGFATLASSLHSATPVAPVEVKGTAIPVPIASIPERGVGGKVGGASVPDEEKAKLIHFGVTCDDCGMGPIVGDRFKCTQRDDYDLCENCVTRDTSEFPMVKITDHNGDKPQCQRKQVHYGIKCDDCGISPITGGRNKCTIRDDFDLCDTCAVLDTTGFPMSKIGVPIPVQFNPHGGWRRGFRGGRPCGPQGPGGGGRGRGHWGGGGGPASGGRGGRGGQGGPPHPHPMHPPHHPMHPHHPRGRNPFPGCPFAGNPLHGNPFSPPPPPPPLFHPMFGGKSRCPADPARKEEMLKCWSDKIGKWSDKIDKLQERIKTVSEEEDALVQEAIYESLSDEEEKVVSRAVEDSITSNHKNVCHVPTFPPAVQVLPKPALRFVRDITYPDGIIIAPGTEFNKVWRIRNDGQIDWPMGVMLHNAGGDILSDPEARVSLPVLRAGDEVNISVQLRAPECSGRFVSYFSAKTAEGQGFGQRLWASVVVSEDAIQYSMLDHSDGAESVTPITDNSEKDSVQNTEPNHVVVGDAKILDILSEEIEEPTFYPPPPTSTPAPAATGSSASVGSWATTPTVNVTIQGRTSNPTIQVETSFGVDSAFEFENGEDTLMLQKWAKELALLREMGFNEQEEILPLLEEHCKTPAAQQGGIPSQNGLMLVVGALLLSQSTGL